MGLDDSPGDAKSQPGAPGRPRPRRVGAEGSLEQAAYLLLRNSFTAVDYLYLYLRPHVSRSDVYTPIGRGVPYRVLH